jgi:hypothetical protein
LDDAAPVKKRCYIQAYQKSLKGNLYPPYISFGLGCSWPLSLESWERTTLVSIGKIQVSARPRIWQKASEQADKSPKGLQKGGLDHEALIVVLYPRDCNTE